MVNHCGHTFDCHRIWRGLVLEYQRSHLLSQCAIRPINCWSPKWLASTHPANAPFCFFFSPGREMSCRRECRGSGESHGLDRSLQFLRLLPGTSSWGVPYPFASRRRNPNHALQLWLAQLEHRDTSGDWTVMSCEVVTECLTATLFAWDWPPGQMYGWYMLSKACPGMTVTFYSKGTHTIIKTWLSKPVSWGGAGVRGVPFSAPPVEYTLILYFLKQIQVFSIWPMNLTFVDVFCAPILFCCAHTSWVNKRVFILQPPRPPGF